MLKKQMSSVNRVKTRKILRQETNSLTSMKSKTKSLPDVNLSMYGGKEESIRVCTRLRPLFQNEIDNGHLKAWNVEEKVMHLVIDTSNNSEITELQKTNRKSQKLKSSCFSSLSAQDTAIRKHFAFDRCFDMETDNSEVYKHVVMDIVFDTFKGINGACMAYGQTGSGKTYSIMGTPEDPGILPRSLADFFDMISNPSILFEDDEDSYHSDAEKVENASNANNDIEFLMRISYIEIYMERVNDLLQDAAGNSNYSTENLDVKEDPRKGFFVVGLHEETVSSMEQVMNIIAKAEQKRHFARTNFNEVSSRSHTVFTVILESSTTLSDGTSISRRGELKIVDLAGNERAGKASEGLGESSKTILDEGKYINKSLFLLSEVISKLSKRAQLAASNDDKKIQKSKEEVFIPWRDSKLTRILSKSLGGNCRASVIVAVHPSHLFLDTSLSTLRFAMKCKTIKKKIHVNYLSPEQSVIMQQKELIEKLQDQLRKITRETGVGLSLDTLNLDSIVDSNSSKDIFNKPEYDEKVQELREELEKKIKKFQSFIMSSPPPDPNLSYSASAVGLKKSRTIIFSKQHLSHASTMISPLYSKVLLSSGDYINAKDTDISEKRVSMMTAINFLKNINDISNEVEEESIKNTDTLGSIESQLSHKTTFENLVGEIESNYKLMMKDVKEQEKEEENEGEKDTLGDKQGVLLKKDENLNGARSESSIMTCSAPVELVNKLNKKLRKERMENYKIKLKNNELASQAKFINALMKKLGLSVLTTGVCPNTSLSKEEESALSINAEVYENTLHSFNSKFDELVEMKPLVYAMLNKTLSHAIYRAFRDDEKFLGEIIQCVPKEEENLLTENVNKNKTNKFYEKIDTNTQNVSLPNTTAVLIAQHKKIMTLCYKVVDEANVNIKHEDKNKNSSFDGEACYDDIIFKIVEKKKKSILDSILALLTPWEQQLLVLLYEQQEMRKSMEQLREYFYQQLNEFNTTIRKLSIEKLELSEHCERLLGEVWNYRQHLEKNEDSNSNAKFAKLMQKLEELSIQNADKNTSYQILSEEFSKLKQENHRLQEKVKSLTDENSAFFMSPEILPFMEELTAITDNEKRMLARALMSMQVKLSDLRLRFEELRAVEEDMRNLNATLYTELVRANETIKDTRQQNKLSEFTIKKERKLTSEQLQKALEDETVLNQKLKILEEKLAEAENKLKKFENSDADVIVDHKEELVPNEKVDLHLEKLNDENEKLPVCTPEADTKEFSNKILKPKLKSAKSMSKVTKMKVKTKTKSNIFTEKQNLLDIRDIFKSHTLSFKAMENKASATINKNVKIKQNNEVKKREKKKNIQNLKEEKPLGKTKLKELSFKSQPQSFKLDSRDKQGVNGKIISRKK